MNDIYRSQMWGFKSFLDNVIDNGFHIGESGYFSNHPPPPAHNHHGGNHHVGMPLTPTTNHHYHNPVAPAATQYNMNMDIKMDPDHSMMEASEYSPQSYMLSDSPSGSSESPSDLQGQGRRKNKEDKVCGVCGDRALGYNFDAISCESCKAFFRRNAPKGLEYFKCPYDEKCKMDVSNRRFCKRCRLKKCFEIGMRKEYILTEEEKAKKRMKIEENRVERKTQSGSPQDTFGMMQDLESKGMLPTEVTSQTQAMAPDEHEEIQDLIAAYHSSLEVTTSKDFPRDMTSNVTDLVNIAELSVRRVIDMVKKVKSFKSLSQSDQIALLKGGSIELLILRSVISFDTEKQQFLDETDSEQRAMKLEQFAAGEQGYTGLFEEHMKFIKSLAIDMKTDQTTLILLLVISLFSPDRCNLMNKELVAEEQEHYSQLLLKYLESKYSVQDARTRYPRLLMKLTDIRNLNEEHSQVLLKVNPDGIQPLMQEVLDLQKKQKEHQSKDGEAEKDTTPTLNPLTQI